MNIYLLFALALGTLTGVAEVRVPRAAVAVAVRAEKRAPLEGTRCRGRALSSPARMRRTMTGVWFAPIPLTGSLSPRAPAVNC